MKEAVIISQNVEFADKTKSHTNRLKDMHHYFTTYYTDVPYETSAIDFHDEVLDFLQANFKQYVGMSAQFPVEGWCRFDIKRNGLTKLWEFTIETTYEPELEYMDD